MIPIFQEGTQIHLNGNTEIILAPGYLYLINYLLLATTEPSLPPQAAAPATPPPPEASPPTQPPKKKPAYPSA